MTEAMGLNGNHESGVHEDSLQRARAQSYQKNHLGRRRNRSVRNNSGQCASKVSWWWFPGITWEANCRRAAKRTAMQNSSGNSSSRLMHRRASQPCRRLMTWSGALEGNLGTLWVKKTCFRNITYWCCVAGYMELKHSLRSGGGQEAHKTMEVNRLHMLGKLKLHSSLPSLLKQETTLGVGRLWSTELQRVSQTCRAACKEFKAPRIQLAWVVTNVGGAFRWWSCFWVIPALYAMPIKSIGLPSWSLVQL